MNQSKKTIVDWKGVSRTNASSTAEQGDTPPGFVVGMMEERCVVEVVTAVAVGQRKEWIMCGLWNGLMRMKWTVMRDAYYGHRPLKDGYRGGVCEYARRRGKVLGFEVDGSGRCRLT